MGVSSDALDGVQEDAFYKSYSGHQVGLKPLYPLAPNT